MNAKTGLLALTAVGVAVGFTALASRGAFGRYEEPPFKVVEREKGFEIRKYKSRIVAEVEVAGPKKEALNDAFRILAGYIFGKNISKRKIAMTAPVAQSEANEKIKMTVPVQAESTGPAWKVRFFMPAEYRLETLPKPVSSEITLKELDPQVLAVKRFSGSASREKFEAKTEELLSELEGSYKVVGKPVDAYYNPPFTPPFLKRNEVMVPIAYKTE